LRAFGMCKAWLFLGPVLLGFALIGDATFSGFGHRGAYDFVVIARRSAVACLAAAAAPPPAPLAPMAVAFTARFLAGRRIVAQTLGLFGFDFAFACLVSARAFPATSLNSSASFVLIMPAVL